MSTWGIEDDNDGLANVNEMNGPKALREAYEAMKKQNRELADGLAAIQGQLTQQKVASTLSELGVPAAAASLYQGDADPEKVKEWATTMRTVFGGQGAPSTPSSADAAFASPVMDGDTAKQYQSMTEAGAEGTPLGNAEAAMARIGDANDIQSLISAWKTLN